MDLDDHQYPIEAGGWDGMLDLGLLELPGASQITAYCCGKIHQPVQRHATATRACPGPEVSFVVCHFWEIDLVMGLDWMVVKGQPVGAPECSWRGLVRWTCRWDGFCQYSSTVTTRRIIGGVGSDCLGMRRGGGWK